MFSNAFFRITRKLHVSNIKGWERLAFMMSATLFGITFIAAVYFINAFDIEYKYIHLQAFDSKEFEIEDLSFYIGKDPFLGDTATIKVDYKVSEPGNKKFSIIVPASFRPISFRCMDEFQCGQEDASGKSWPHKDGVEVSMYDLNIEAKEASYSVKWIFSDKIISTDKSELDLNIDFGNYYESEISKQNKSFPIKLIIRGIDILDIGDSSIRYSNVSGNRLTNDGGIEFENLSWNESERAILYGSYRGGGTLGEKTYAPEEISVRLKNRKRNYRLQLYLFLAAALIGLMASLTASIVWDVIKKRAKFDQ